MTTVNIRPGINILSVLGHLNYKPWYALGEFVDNAVNSGIEKNWNRLQSLHGHNYKLRVEIELDNRDGGRIVIRDNAAGIARADYLRAFRTAEVPLDRSGLSEFGMGMKSASFWFTNTWTVRTKAVGEKFTGKVRFDLHKIVESGLEQLPIEDETAKLEEHFTELVLLKPEKMPAGRTVGKIKKHLSSIYRQFIRDGKLELWFDGEQLGYDEPKVLVAPREASGAPDTWKKSVSISLPGNKTAKGFVAIREEASTAEAGLALFRRGRLIVGSGDEGYRPTSIFGQPNSYRYQRVFGELHLEGFGVSHTKDAIQWDGLEDDFLSALKKQMNEAPLPILKMAEEYRAKTKTASLTRAAQSAAVSTAQAITNAEPVIAAQRDEQPITTPPPVVLPTPSETAAKRELQLHFKDQDWVVTIDLVNDPAIEEWLDLSQFDSFKSPKAVGIRMNLAHPFIQRFGGSSGEHIEAMLRLATAMAIAETVARDSGVRQVGTIRKHVNELLRKALSNPGTSPLDE